MSQVGPATTDTRRRASFFWTPCHALHAPEWEWGFAAAVPCVETPARVDVIAAAMQKRGWTPSEAEPAKPTELTGVHSSAYMEFLERAAEDWIATGHPLPAVGGNYVPRSSPITRPPASILGRMGYYAFGVGSPILEGTWEAALGAAGVALASARAVAAGDVLSFGLCRPPGHHSGRDYAGGYCYLNNAAIAADWLATHPDNLGHVAVIDLDYHHGNGTQDIFYDRDDVTYFSVHVDPDFDFPYFSGRSGETGVGKGTGFTINTPLPPGADDDTWLSAIRAGLRVMTPPEAIVVSLGLDVVTGDEQFQVTPAGLREAGRILGAVAPLVVLLEGGYVLAELGSNAVAFLDGALEVTSRTRAA